MTLRGREVKRACEECAAPMVVRVNRDEERIAHIIGCYERWRAGKDVDAEEHEKRTEMVMAR